MENLSESTTSATPISEATEELSKEMLAPNGYRQAVAICMKDPQGRWLQIRRAYDNKAGGLIGFAGGKIDSGESQEEALVREAFEELGIDVIPVANFGFVDLDEWAVRMHVWTVLYSNAQLNHSQKEVHETLWLTSEEIFAHPDALPSSALILNLLAEGRE